MIQINKNIDLGKIINEPNFHMFKHNNHICVVYRVPHGHFCGYVGVKKESNCYGVSYNIWSAELTKQEEAISNISIHGGLTYSNNKLSCFDGIFGDNIWWFGFDTAHLDDMRIYDFGYISGSLSETYKDFEYVKQEVIRLSDQIKEIENEK